jgi:hypothetical protein
LEFKKIRDIVTKKFCRIWCKDQYPYLGCGDLGNSCELALFALVLYDKKCMRFCHFGYCCSIYLFLSSTKSSTDSEFGKKTEHVFDVRDWQCQEKHNTSSFWKFGCQNYVRFVSTFSAKAKY